MVNDEIVGRSAVRHELNEFLATIGGHIGYAVLPRFAVGASWTGRGLLPRQPQTLRLRRVGEHGCRQRPEGGTATSEYLTWCGPQQSGTESHPEASSRRTYKSHAVHRKSDGTIADRTACDRFAWQRDPTELLGGDWEQAVPGEPPRCERCMTAVSGGGG